MKSIKDYATKHDEREEWEYDGSDNHYIVKAMIISVFVTCVLLSVWSWLVT